MQSLGIELPMMTGLRETDRQCLVQCLEAEEARARLDDGPRQWLRDAQEEAEEWIGSAGLALHLFWALPALVQSLLAVAMAVASGLHSRKLGLLVAGGGFLLGSCIALLVAACSGGCCCCVSAQGKRLPRKTAQLWALAWFCTALVSMVPVLLMVGGEGDVMISSSGAALFTVSLWGFGWCYLWLHWQDMATIDPSQKIVSIAATSDAILASKLCAVAYECYTYCAFPFFPAVPWQRYGFPEEGLTFIRAGLFDWEGKWQMYVLFYGACCAVLLAPLLLYGFREARNVYFLIITVLFDVLVRQRSLLAQFVL